MFTSSGISRGNFFISSSLGLQLPVDFSFATISYGIGVGEANPPLTEAFPVYGFELTDANAGLSSSVGFLSGDGSIGFAGIRQGSTGRISLDLESYDYEVDADIRVRLPEGISTTSAPVTGGGCTEITTGVQEEWRCSLLVYFMAGLTFQVEASDDYETGDVEWGQTIENRLPSLTESRPLTSFGFPAGVSATSLVTADSIDVEITAAEDVESMSFIGRALTSRSFRSSDYDFGGDFANVCTAVVNRTFLVEFIQCDFGDVAAGTVISGSIASSGPPMELDRLLWSIVDIDDEIPSDSIDRALYRYSDATFVAE